jgi:class 3 adenylate cyclase/predicted ATPase
MAQDAYASGPVICPECQADNKEGAKFCSECGTPLSLRCPSCATPHRPGQKFCDECGTPLTAGAPAAARMSPVSERRLVSVLFADLVGFTALSERRDPEEIRELLSHYFDRCRLLIERYGGVVEKFIGDAVMAVWGSPVAREDDAERAVRAALSLAQEVDALGEEVGMPELRVRAGVLTGNAAVQVGAESEGMVLGDTVNTASRLQSIAAPGTVLVDDVTRRASEAAIAYEDAGNHELKGREQLVHAWTALRVVAGAGGARRSAGLEAPFVGRDRELQAIIEAGERSASDGRAAQVSIVGEAGSGKSRLLWEYFKYLDGIEQVRFWHQGRCLSYGEGVGYWALAEMIRARTGITEDEAPAQAREKLAAAVREHVTDERERRLVEPRLAHLLRLEERPEADRADLFSGWRLFFERLAATRPVVLAFEDLQWADSGLLDFIDYLLEWSAEFPIFILALGRSELRDRRPAWQPLVLEPLDPASVTSILDGLAPGLPAELVLDIGRRAEGIPLYAIETIRMLQDRGLLVQEGARYVVTGDVSDLDVPETLHALVASRLDGLSPEERSLLQDASVLGQSFTAEAAAALGGLSESEVRRRLDGLVAKQVLARDEDPRSPERGQYAFLQALLHTVAYGTLGRRTRKARHVAAARHLEQTWPGQAADIAEVLASHYLEAVRAEPDAEDVGALRASARETLSAAGRAAASLGLGPEASRYFEQAGELAGDELERAELLEQAGQALWHSGDNDGAEQRLRQAIDLYRRNGRVSGGSATVTLGRVAIAAARSSEALSLLQSFREPAAAGLDVTVRAEGLAELGRALMIEGDRAQALPLLEEALRELEAQEAWPALAQTLITRSVFLIQERRTQEGIGVLRQALLICDEHDLSTEAMRARFNMAAMGLESDRLREAAHEVVEGLALARKRGDRVNESLLLSQHVPCLVTLGEWAEAISAAETLLARDGALDATYAAAFLVQVADARGDVESLERCRVLATAHRDSTNVDLGFSALLVLARCALAASDPAAALELARPLLAARPSGYEMLTEAYELCLEAAMATGDDGVLAALEEHVDSLAPNGRTPIMRAGRARIVAHRMADNLDASDDAEREAISLLRDVDARPLLARTLLERAGRRDDPEALAEARAICTELGATRWLARLEQAVA